MTLRFPYGAALPMRVKWGALVLGVAASMAIGTAAALENHRIVDAGQSVTAEIAAIQVGLESASSDHGRGLQRASANEDFSRRLPTAIDLQEFLGVAQQSCTQGSATITSAQVQSRIAERGELSRMDLTLAIRGVYPRLKDVLSDVFSRFPSVALAHLSLQRPSATTVLEARVVFALWARTEGSLSSPGQSASDTGQR